REPGSRSGGRAPHLGALGRVIRARLRDPRPRRLRRAAVHLLPVLTMKLRYLVRCLLFALPVVGVVVGAEARLRACSPSVLVYKKRFLEDALARIEVLVLG